MFWKSDLGYLNLGGVGSISQPKSKSGRFFDFFLLFGGVLLPVAAVAYESLTHTCARTFFDPLPGTLHAVLFSLIPISNFLAWLSLRCDMSPHYGFMLLANGMAVGIGLLYTLMFLPIMPISCVAVVVGLGWFGLAPFLSLISLWRGGVHVTKLSGAASTYFHAAQVKHLGHVIVLTLVIAVELPSTLTRIAIDMACEGKQQGLDILRAFGNEEVMLRACYERSGRATDVLGSLYEVSHHHDINKVREIFYKTTGRAFNSLPIPDSARATMLHVGLINAFDEGISAAPGFEADDEFDRDPDVAGEAVSGVSRGLGVAKSVITADVDADAAVAQCNWYLSLDNKSNYDREVRTKIKLPHGAVINQASLIVDGKEYEAAIQGRSEARTTYQAAVAQRRNPLLVSTCGLDSVLVQCYPVPPKHDIKLRIGMVTPLSLDRNRQGVLVLPQFEERNFQINVPHDLTIISTGDISMSGKMEKGRSTGGFTATGKIDGSELAKGDGIVHIARNAKITQFWSEDSVSNNIIVEEMVPAKWAKAPKHLYVVIDGSNCMKSAMKDIASALSQLPGDMHVKLMFVGDRGDERLTKGYFRAGSAKFADSLERLKQEICVGGQSDCETVCSAIRSASKKTDPAVLWIHGAQPVSDPHEYKNLVLSQNQDPITLYDMQISSGPNGLSAELDGNINFQKVARFGDIKDDLTYLFDGWKGTVQPLEIEYGFMSPFQASPSLTKKPSRNLLLGQLWVNQQIMAYEAKVGCHPSSEFTSLAANYHIVTPLSSAVLVTPVPALYDTPAFNANGEQTWFDGVCSGVRELGSSLTPQSIRLSRETVAQQLNRLNSVSDKAVCSDMAGPMKGAEMTPSAPSDQDMLIAAGGEPVAIPNPLVPESDSWLLLGATGIMLGTILLRHRKAVRRA